MSAYHLEVGVVDLNSRESLTTRAAPGLLVHPKTQIDTAGLLVYRVNH